RAALRSLIESLRDIITAITGKETIDGLHIAVAGQGEANVRQVRLALDGSAPDGMLRGWFEVGLDGIAVQDLPPNVASLVPTHVALRPSVAGVSLADLMTLALEATEPDADSALLVGDAEALLTHGGITLGLDSLDIDLGPATLRAHGQAVVTAVDEYQAEAHVTATGIDALMQQARGNPDLRQALPVLAM